MRARNSPRMALAVASLFMLAATCLVAPAPAGAAPEELYDITTFAMVPEPGHSFMAFPAEGVVYATTAGGNPTTFNTKGERLLTYDRHGRLLDTQPVPAAAPNMGLYDLVRDAEGRLYVGDMNGRVLRFTLRDGRPTDGEVYATIPPPYVLGLWYASMWNGLAFDPAGNLYVSDSQTGAIWRIPPNGQPEIYFRDARLAGGAPGGPFGATIGPDGKLYITILGSALPGNVHDGIVYRLRLSDSPTGADLETFHVFRSGPEQPLPGPMDVAFGKSGRVYVTLGYGYQLAVLSSDGAELRRISSPLFATPTGLAWLGRSLLVANADFAPEERDKWRILKVFVDDDGVAPVTPSLGEHAHPPLAQAGGVTDLSGGLAGPVDADAVGHESHFGPPMTSP